MTGDRITLRGLRAHGYHGVLDHERRDGQTFVIDLDLALDLRPAAEGDQLSRTVDYGALAVRIRDAVESDPVDLIETLADRLASLALCEPAVTWTRVTVHKPHAPVPVPLDDVAVTIERSRP